MRHLPAALLVFLSLLLSAPAWANFDQSKAWFDALSANERTETQANLTLLGYYEFLVDGQFGNGTYQALTAFQRSQGRAATGVLIPQDRDALLERAAHVYGELGMDLVRDEEGQAALIMPVGLLTERTASERGNSYATADGGVSLQTIRLPLAEQPFGDHYETLKTPGNGRFITYSNFNDDRFVVSGKESGRSFYTMFQNAETESVGYTLSWTDDNEQLAKMLSIFIASHFVPLRYMPPGDEEVKIAETPSVATRYGVFSLPENEPDVILLNGEVTHTLESDFHRALEARPDAHIIVLNSPGGYVDNALQVAHEVRRRGMSTLVGDGMGCYSACAYIYFAGKSRYVEGELGVHQISAEVADLVLAQTTLSDVLDALDEYGVQQEIITVMLKTPPEDMYVFTTGEIAELGINQGDKVEVADLSTLTTTPNAPSDDATLTPASDTPNVPDTPSTGTAYVELSQQSSQVEADRSLDYARERWAGVLGEATPEVERFDSDRGAIYRVRVPARSLESANALCEAIKSAGGGCYVTEG